MVNMRPHQLHLSDWEYEHYTSCMQCRWLALVLESHSLVACGGAFLQFRLHLQSNYIHDTMSVECLPLQSKLADVSKDFKNVLELRTEVH